MNEPLKKAIDAFQAIGANLVELELALGQVPDLGELPTSHQDAVNSLGFACIGLRQSHGMYSDSLRHAIGDQS